MTEPVFYAVGGGFRALAKAHLAAVEAPVRVVHGYTVAADRMRAFAKKIWHLAPEKLAGMSGVASRRVSTLPAAAIVLDRVIKHLGPERVVFSAWACARAGSTPSCPNRALSRSPGRGRPTVRPAARACPAVRTRIGALDRPAVPGRDARRPPPAPRRVRGVRHRLARPSRRAGRGELPPPAPVPFIGVDHAERVFLALAIHARYAGAADARWLEPAVSLLSPSLRRRAMILGRTLLLGYRFSGGVPEIGRCPPAHRRRYRPWRWAAPPASRTAKWSATGSGCWRPPSGVRRTEIVEAQCRGSPE